MTIEQRLDQLEKRNKRLTVALTMTVVALTMTVVAMCAVVTIHGVPTASHNPSLAATGTLKPGP